MILRAKIAYQARIASLGALVERPIGSATASTAPFRMAPAVSSAANPNLLVRRGDWFGSASCSKCLESWVTVKRGPA